MRLLVCGSRDFENEVLVLQILHDMYYESGLASSTREFTLIEGGATGADAHAAKFVEQFLKKQNEFVFHEQYPADWDTHGKAAGPIRNKQMLEEGKPDQVLAFINKPLVESRGTKNMVELAEKAGLPVIIVETRNM